MQNIKLSLTCIINAFNAVKYENTVENPSLYFNN